MVDFAFHHAGISVASLEDAIAWYGRVLGFAVERRFYIEAARSRTAMLRKDALRFEILEVEDAAPLPEERRSPQADLRTHGNKHVAFRVRDLDGFLAEMETKGVDIALVVRETFGKGCFIRDCAGNLIEFVEDSTDGI
jgi:methylmalonyl-CoA/ethylmalonyl-CoA epimerase